MTRGEASATAEAESVLKAFNERVESGAGTGAELMDAALRSMSAAGVDGESYRRAVMTEGAE